MKRSLSHLRLAEIGEQAGFARYMNRVINELERAANLTVTEPLLLRDDELFGRNLSLRKRPAGGGAPTADEVLFGKPLATWDNGAVIQVRPCTIDGVNTGDGGGADDVFVFLNADQSTLDIRNYDDGFYTSTTSATLTTSAILYYLEGPAHDVTIDEEEVSVSHYVLGEPLMTVQYRPNPTTRKWQALVWWQIGQALAKGSWFDLDGAAYEQGAACA